MGYEYRKSPEYRESQRIAANTRWNDLGYRKRNRDAFEKGIQDLNDTRRIKKLRKAQP